MHVNVTAQQWDCTAMKTAWFLHLKSAEYSYVIRHVKAFSVSTITSGFKALIDWKDV